MIELDIPGRGHLTLANLVLDMNGTIALDGKLIPGVAERITALKLQLDVSMITADIHSSAQEIAAELEVAMIKITPGDEGGQKLRYLHKLGSLKSVCIGNGANDTLMLGEAAVGICAIGPEGAAIEALKNSAVVVSDINLALDLLLNPLRLIATLRK